LKSGDEKMAVTINIPLELYDQARSVAEAHHVPVELVLESALADQFAVWQRLQERARRGNRQNFLAVLDNVPDTEPDEFDRL
jgi:predicted transcriptional regulator